ncbi:organic cation transporter protein-like [Haliotis cracherodii]|uniref:organic cation transporter protein-like n=1 Tax=Haliotis cracherodii TaxID=6455 RepID=UPI0039E96F16
MASNVQVDPLLNALNGKGRYQILQFSLCKASTISVAVVIFSFVFVGRNIPHVCSKPSNTSEVITAIDDDTFTINNSNIYYDKCNIRVVANVSGHTETKQLPCVFGYIFSERKDLSIISDYYIQMELVCEKAPLRALGMSLFFLGQVIGASTLPIVSDRHGRRPVHLISHFCVLVLGICASFSPNYTVFLVVRFFTGIVHSGLVLTDATISVELFPAQHRKLFGFITNQFRIWGLVVLAGLAYSLRDQSWRWLQLGLTSVSLSVIPAAVLLDETLRWLIVHGRVDDIRKTLEKAARMNKVDKRHVMEEFGNIQDHHKSLLPRRLSLGMEPNSLTSQGKEDSENTVKVTHSLADLLKVKRLAINTIAMWFIWLSSSMILLGIYLTSESLAAGRYINFFVIAIIPCPSGVIFYFMVDRYGRKTTLWALYIITTGGLAVATAVRIFSVSDGNAAIASTIFSCFGAMGITEITSTLFFYTPEMFPTTMRSVGLGSSAAIGRVGGIVIPFIILMADDITWAPGVILTAMAVITLVLIQVLPETKGRELPQTLEDLKGWYRKTS